MNTGKASLLIAVLTCLSANTFATSANVALKVALGKSLFNDSSLSEPAGQSCASCHKATNGHSDQHQIVSPGANPLLFGNRNAPSIHYIKYNPELYWNGEDETWMGGFFLDGRAQTLREQTKGPLLNPLEMGNKNADQISQKIKAASYKDLFIQVYGAAVFDNPEDTLEAAADAIVQYEQGPEFALFSSKYDYYLQGRVELSEKERQGLDLFEAEDKGNCAACHPSAVKEDGQHPVFTDFSYDNLGAGANDALPYLAMVSSINPDGKDYRDLGLALNPHIDNNSDEKGKFKVPTLRNLTLTAPYLHNGLFGTLEEVVDFYNTRDVDSKWPAPEVADNVNKDELGDLGLSQSEVEAIVAFLEILTDGYVVDQRYNADDN